MREKEISEGGMCHIPNACYTQSMPNSYKLARVLNQKEREELAKYNNLISHLLFHRSISTSEEAEKFMEPSYENGVHDPFLLKDAEKSADRIIKAIKNKEKIVIYGDYDADGIPASAIFNDFFKRIGYENFSIYIPHRHNEGFGLNKEAIEQLAGEKVNLLITVDCGVTDVEPVALANKLGMEVIITDHHEPPAKLPPAFAIIDHKQVDCNYPDKNLCGSGVAFKLIQAILKKDRLGMKEGHEKWFLDLVGIATLSDMVPLIGENRIFAHYGLAVLRKSPRKGLTRLLSKLKINQKYINEDDVAFMITPRINAASRMGQPMDAFNLLTAETDTDAEKYADHLDKINNERKGVVASLVKEVKKILHERYRDEVPRVIVLGNPLWRPSLLGLVANTCAEEYDRPAFFWGRDGDNTIKGSCRSEGRTNVVELMRASLPETFIQFGGHKHSGGFAVSNDEIHFLEQRLVEAVNGLSAKETLSLKNIDAELSINEVNEGLQKDLDKLAPFGVGNPKPVFLFKNIQPVSFRKFGKTGDHVELIFKNSSGRKLSAIAFFGAKEKWVEEIKINMQIDLMASIEKSMFGGRSEIRLRVVEVVPVIT